MQDTAGEAGTSSLVMYSNGPPHMAEQKQDGLLEHTYSSYVRIRDVALNTCQRRWTIGRSGERGSGISVLAAWHDDDDDDKLKLFAPSFLWVWNQTPWRNLQTRVLPRGFLLKFLYMIRRIVRMLWTNFFKNSSDFFQKFLQFLVLCDWEADYFKP